MTISIPTTAAAVTALAMTFAAGMALANAQATKKAYVLVQVDVTNPQQYQEYAKLTPAIVESFGGRFLARAGRIATLEGPPAKAARRRDRVPELRQGAGVLRVARLHCRAQAA